MNVTRKGQVFSLAGEQLQVGTQAPSFRLKDQYFKEFHLDDYQGQTILLSVVPDINTRVCSLQTRRFNQEAAELKDIQFVTISNNTAQEQAGWCAAKGIDVRLLHDTDLVFGQAYGLYLPDFGHLARAVLVIDGTGTLIYQEILTDISEEPNYHKAITAAQQA